MASIYDDCVDLDVLTFKGSILKGARGFTKSMNPCAACECAKDEYEQSFERLNYSGLVKVSETTIRHRKKCLVFEKLSL